LIRDNFEKSDLPFDKETFETHYQDLYQEMLRHPSPCGFLHGDAHPGNFFFDEESQRLTMIDMDAITLSVSHRGTPAGPSVFDYIFASESCRIYGTLHGLSDQEIRELTIAFEESYLDEIGDLFPSEQSIRYYRFLFWLNKINLTNTADPDLSKKIWEQSQKIREMAITYLCEDMEKL